jgi:hypothetical protein
MVSSEAHRNVGMMSFMSLRLHLEMRRTGVTLWKEISGAIASAECRFSWSKDMVVAFVDLLTLLMSQ